MTKINKTNKKRRTDYTFEHIENNRIIIQTFGRSEILCQQKMLV